MTKPRGIVLREKDLSEEEYKKLAKAVIEICDGYKVDCILHNFIDVAKLCKADGIHLPFQKLKETSKFELENFINIGTSCHSVQDAIFAEKMGCTYIFAGHVYDTDCKPGLPSRGLSFLEEVCKSVTIPVFAIGGINKSRIPEVLNVGAKGGCVMSGFMTGDEWI